MLPSFGSTSIPADVPHFRPAGSSPQLRVTFGAGFGRPSPVMGFATLAPCAETVARVPKALHAATANTAQAPRAKSPVFGVDMRPPLTGDGKILRGCGPRSSTNGPRVSLRIQRDGRAGPRTSPREVEDRGQPLKCG